MKTARHAVLLLVLMLAVAAAYGEEPSADAQKLADQVKGAKVSLERGLQASTRQGTPISGKFESEDGKTAALGLHVEGRQVLRSGRRSHERESRQGRRDHERR